MARTRDEVINEYVEAIIDGMDVKTLSLALSGLFIKELQGYSNAQLKEQIGTFYPEIVEDFG